MILSVVKILEIYYNFLANDIFVLFCKITYNSLKTWLNLIVVGNTTVTQCAISPPFLRSVILENNGNFSFCRRRIPISGLIGDVFYNHQKIEF